MKINILFIFKKLKNEYFLFKIIYNQGEARWDKVTSKHVLDF